MDTAFVRTLHNLIYCCQDAQNGKKVHNNQECITAFTIFLGIGPQISILMKQCFTEGIWL